MREAVKDAVDSACSAGITQRRCHRRTMVVAILNSVLRDVPEDMTVRELREILETL